MAHPSFADAKHELTITGVATDGAGVGRLADGRVAFVRGALPGDRVLARVTDAKARVVFADTELLLTPSSSRAESLCRVDACDSCPFRQLSYEAQLSAKADTVLQAFARIGRIDVSGVFHGANRRMPYAPTNPWHYRHRVRLHAHHHGQWQLGFFARGTHDVVSVDACPVVWPELEAAVRTFSLWLADKPAHWRVRDVEIAYSRRDQAAAAEVRAEGADLSDAPFGARRLRYDQSRPFDLMFEPGVFTQANTDMNAQLVDAVIAATSGSPRVLELHAGIGNFSLPLALGGHHVRATEANRRASYLATTNACAAGLAIDTATLSDAIAVNDASDFDAVVMDPPRTGAREAAAVLATKGPPRLVYVSCDPATLARDVQTLVAGGYRVTSLAAFDMFPQTPHIESLAVLTR